MIRKLLTFVSFVLALVFVLPLSFLSCDDENEDPFGELYDAVSAYEDAVSKEEAQEALDERKTYVIVIPENCGTELFNSAALLSQVMSKYVGYEVELYYDSEIKPKSTNFEILIGETDRDKSQRYAKSLRAYDYGYEYADGALTICAHSDILVARAVDAFSDGIVSGEISTVYINATKPFLVSSEYEISEVSLLGFPISEYVIVYPISNKNSERALAEKLKQELEECTGYSLPVVSDSEAKDFMRFICVGESSVSIFEPALSNAVVTVSENGNIELLAKDNYGINLASKSFIDLIKSSRLGNVCRLDTIPTVNTAYQNDEISFFVVRDDFLSGDVDEYTKTVNEVATCSVALFDSLSESVEANLSCNLVSLISVENKSYFYFNYSKVRCVESKSVALDGGEIFTLVFENQKGERFAFVGGFNDGGKEKIESSAFLEKLSEECARFDDMPLIVAHELSGELDKSFAKENLRLVPVGAGKEIYISADRLEVVGESESEISSTIYADVFKVKLCFK